MKNFAKKIFFCTGARNHELLKSFDDKELVFEFDERSASFKALGLAKALNQPVAICTTSGTAVSECISAMLEAYYSEIPLILITGDRPKKLHGTGAPQTIDHEALTKSCRRNYIEISVNDLSSLDLKDEKYPLHINVLVDDTKHHELSIKIQSDLEAFRTFALRHRSPLILVSHEAGSMRPFIEKISKMGLTFYAETLSGGRDLSSIKTEKKLLELFNSGIFDSVIRIGHTPLSKVWRLLERSPLPVFHFDTRSLPALSFGDLLPLGSRHLFQEESFWETLKGLNQIKFSDVSDQTLLQLMSAFPNSEISYFGKIQEKLKEDDTVYLGNSLVIRFFELTQNKRLNVFGNRGVNGIDGQLATAIGLALGTKAKVYTILGDITTFYDLSSLRDLPRNLFLIIINNKGGRIFDFLNLDKRIILEHESDFENIAAGFGLSYSKDLNQFGEVQVLELNPRREESQKMLQEWIR